MPELARPDAHVGQRTRQHPAQRAGSKAGWADRPFCSRVLAGQNSLSQIIRRSNLVLLFGKNQNHLNTNPMNEYDDPYSTFSLEQRFKETGSLVEHIMIMADFLEFQVNRIIDAGENDSVFPGMVRKANFTPEQRFGYAMGRTSIFLSLDGEWGESIEYFIGRINEIYALRRQLPTLSQADLEARVKRLYHVNKGDEEKWEVITTVIASFKEVPGNADELLPTDLFDRFAVPIYDFLIDFTDGFLQIISDFMKDPDAKPDAGEPIDLEDEGEG